MQHINFLSPSLQSHLKIKPSSVNKCKGKTKLSCEEKCVLNIYKLYFSE